MSQPLPRVRVKKKRQWRLGALHRLFTAAEDRCGVPLHPTVTAAVGEGFGPTDGPPIDWGRPPLPYPRRCFLASHACPLVRRTQK